MSELRTDPITGRESLISPLRGGRPFNFVHERATITKRDFNPLAEGAEKETPSELLAYRRPGTQPNTPGWWVRAVPNKFPAVSDEAGSHEVIIERPDAVDQIDDLPPAHLADIFRAYRDRLVAHRKTKAIAYVQIFKNHGVLAGASLKHAHSQLIALPFVPTSIQARLQRVEAYAACKGRCLLCDHLADELKTGGRLVLEDDHFAAFTSFAPSFPGEMRLLPKKHATSFEEIRDDALLSLGALFKKLLFALNTAFSSPDYNLMLYTSPFRSPPDTSFHWHFELLPRVMAQAGFEQATGCTIITLTPEEAAEKLRAALTSAKGAG